MKLHSCDHLRQSCRPHGRISSLVFIQSDTVYSSLRFFKMFSRKLLLRYITCLGRRATVVLPTSSQRQLARNHLTKSCGRQTASQCFHWLTSLFELSPPYKNRSEDVKNVNGNLSIKVDVNRRVPNSHAHFLHLQVSCRVSMIHTYFLWRTHKFRGQCA